jgi:hypothetical protein
MLRKLLISVLFCFAFVVTGHAQKIDPSYQINWANSTGCSTVGQPYIPASNTCVPLGAVLLAPTGAQTIVQPSAAQPLAVNYLAPQFVNGVPQAAAWPSGSDGCAKLQNAMVYAIQNNLNYVDATGFQGTQSCAANPFNLTTAVAVGAITNLTVKFGNTHFQTSAQWHITNSGLKLEFPGPMQFQLEYTGSTVIDGALYIDGTSSQVTGNGINVDITGGLFVYGDNNAAGSTANLSDGILIQDTNRSRFENLYSWGVSGSGCGIHSQGNVTSTWYRPHVSHTDFVFLTKGSISGHSTPSNGLCFNLSTSTGFQTTDSTVVDAIAEGVTGQGWYLVNANSMVFTGGTSEANGHGILIAANSKYNEFFSSDLEGNTANTTGVDIIDNAGFNQFQQIIASSPCTGGCTGSVNLTGAGGQDWFTGPAGSIYSAVGAGLYGFTPFNPLAGGALPATATGYIQMWVRGSLVKLPYY